MTLSTRGLTANLVREHGFEALPVEGTLPPGLAGTLVRNGPGVMERFGVRYEHLFEGDGAITALRLAGGQASGSSRIVRSEGFVREEKAGRHLSSFAAAWPLRFWNMHRSGLKNTANTSVLHWQDRLFALMEGDKPLELDAETFETLGTEALGCIEGTFSAHPHRVEALGTTFNFGFSYGKETFLNVYALPDDGPARRIARVQVGAPVLMHDFIATSTHLLFFVAPLQMKVMRMMLALGPFHDNFFWNPDAGTEIIAVPLADPDSVVRFTVPAFYQWHFLNAFDDGPQQVVVDYIHEDDGSSMQDFIGVEQMAFEEPRMLGKGQLYRARLDLDRKTFVTEPISQRVAEFPMLRPQDLGRRHHEGWIHIERFEDGLMEFGLGRVTDDGLQERWLDRGQMCGEPVFVPQGEDGCLITLVYDGRSQLSHWDLCNARTLQTQATIALKHAIPVTFHGSWSAAR